jgi:hypothetical protein
MGRDNNGVAVWLNHTGCPGIIPGVDKVWPRMVPVQTSHYDWQDTYACPKCALQIVASLVKEREKEAEQPPTPPET